MTSPSPTNSEKIKALGGSVVHVLGSMTIFLHVGNKTFKALCQVTNTDDCLLMGRTLAKAMGYINYPDIKPPTCRGITQIHRSPSRLRPFHKADSLSH